jgi:NAD(P)-dependent dehydrogenase (short-subunit alcohol dehydrogenase family)
LADLLKDKVAVVTGGASGIGLAMVDAFVEQGAKVMVGDIKISAMETLNAHYGDRVDFRITDVRDENQIAELVSAAVNRFGRLDVMCNNAGSMGDPAPILETETTGFLDTLNLLLASVLAGHKYAARQFIAQGTGGSIITTSSIAGIQGGFSPVGYVSAKAGILGMIKQATEELGPHGIRANAILPGIITTPIIGSSFGVAQESLNAFTDTISDRLGEKVPLRRAGIPSDIAGAAVFLASDLSAFVSGVALPVDGGMTAVTQSQTIQTILDTASDYAQT